MADPRANISTWPLKKTFPKEPVKLHCLVLRYSLFFMVKNSPVGNIDVGIATDCMVTVQNHQAGVQNIV